MKISYNWLKWYVPAIPEAEKLADVFSCHLCEVESLTPVIPGLTRNPGSDSNAASLDSGAEAGMTQPQDWVFDLNILPNRAHDLLSFHGLARELSGQLGIEFKDPTPYYKIPNSMPTKLKIDVQTPLCRRYMGRIVRNIKVGPSPEWVVKHLESIGQRSINNIVDATNICMFDCGQPMHAFSMQGIKNGELIIRNGNAGEKMTTLDGRAVDLLPSDIVIADAEGSLALGGVKGGTKAEVDSSTADVMLEVANFAPAAVRKTARRLGIFTDSAKRFENDLSPELGDFAMMELCALIMEMCPEAVFEDIVDVYPDPQEKRELSFTVSEINKKLGANISVEEVTDILTRYKYEFTEEGERIRLAVPPLRLDLTGSHDMAEEIGRIYGYENIVPEIPKISFIPKANETHARISAARAKLLADGYCEVMTYTFCKKGKVEVARGPKGKEFLRTSLADGLKESYEMNRLNAPLIGESEIKIFEIGTVFPSVDAQETHVAYADKKGVVEATLEEFTRDGVIPGLTRNPGSDSNAASLNSGAEAGMTQNSKSAFVMWSEYPFITRDVAVWVPAGTEAGELIQLCKKEGTDLLIREPQLFDQFTKGDRTSLAVRMIFQSMERTLTDPEVTEIMAGITSAIQAKGWEVR